MSHPSATAWLERLRGGELSAVELVDATLARVEAANHRLNAVVAWRDDAARREARAADAARRAGDDRPLLGLPVTIKDALDVAGLPTAAGSLARLGHVAEDDATVVARLVEAGAIVIAKTNVPEVCCSFETDNVAFGRTEHPLVAGRTPGGSSGGEAALLGADASIAGIGTDGGGSIRAPSHFVGTVGLRPTTGRTAETGVWPPTRATGMMDMTCVGPMARQVEDLELLLRVIAGADGRDPYAIDVPLRPARVRDPLRVGVYDTHPEAPPVTPGTALAVRRAAEVLAARGCEVETIEPPEGCATELFFAASGADGGAHLRRAVAAANGRHHPQFAALLGSPVHPPPTADAFFGLQRELFAYRSRVRRRLAEYDVVLSPVVAGPAPEHGRPPADVPQSDYLRYRAFEFCHVNAVAGVPAAVVPVGTEDGLPIGVQIAAAPWREDLVLAAAALLEAELGGFAINRRLALAASIENQTPSAGPKASAASSTGSPAT